MNSWIGSSILILGMFANLSLAKVGWKPIFDGKTKAGWHIAGSSADWSIDPVDSAWVGYQFTTATQYSMVFTDSSYDQFTIKYSYRLKAGCSGFFFRTIETASSPYVQGAQVEAKWETGPKASSYVGSIYNSGGNTNTGLGEGWVAATINGTNTFGKTAVTNDQVYQNVVLTVKKPYIYVNVNGFQAIGETDAALLATGSLRAFEYFAKGMVYNPGKFGLQIHGGQTKMDVRFKNIAILQGCGDATKPGYDGNLVPNLTKQPAVYLDNGTCDGTPVLSGKAEQDGLHFIRVSKQGSNPLRVHVLYPGEHTLELVTLDGQIVFSAANPMAKEYTLSMPLERGIFFAKVKTHSHSFVRKIFIE